MEATFEQKHPLPMGKIIERIRMFKGIKQEYMAARLGISQSKISKIEQRKQIDTALLKQICSILQIEPEAVIYFDDALVTNNINNYAKPNPESSNAAGAISSGWSDLKFYHFISHLYERLLKSEREKFELIRNLHTK